MGHGKKTAKQQKKVKKERMRSKPKKGNKGK